MAEHLNMAYDEPREIGLKIKSTDHTILHSWFGSHYKKTGSLKSADDEGKETDYDIVTVRTSPAMMVHWAMQYGTSVEILDEDIRNEIGKELEKMRKIYGSNKRQYSGNIRQEEEQ